MAPTFVPTLHVVPACMSCNFKVYPFQRPVQNKCAELMADKRKYIQHRQRIIQAQSTVYSPIQKKNRREDEDYKMISNFIDRHEVDFAIDDVITKINRFFTVYSNDDQPYKVHSLNYIKRKQELNRIIQENDSLYRRLINQKSCYPIEQMKKDWKYQQDLFMRISKFPNNWIKTNRKRNLPPIEKRYSEIKPIVFMPKRLSN